jgi:transcription-repair coupling factor (superfamily II helicase)
MLDFVAGRYDLLVSTLIIESGLDIPTVNTMIVNRSDALGLAQLYQLRGRVGRSSVQAYAYLLVPPRTVLTEQAEKRLRAMSEFEGLGSGFALAMRDLEIRGAGNILGEEQHGFVASVGFDLYCRMLEDTVRELKGEVVEERKEPRLVTDVDAFLPDEYVGDGEEKLGIYRRLASAKAIEDVDAIEAELADRYGALPLPAVSLLDLRRVRLLAAKLGADSVAVRRERVEIELAKAPSRGELREIMSGITLPIEFRTGERFSFRARETKGDALRTARMLLLEATGFRRVEKIPSRTKGTS